MKIVIEGMDGVGKSTVAKKVAQMLNACYADGMLFQFLQEEGMTKQEVATVKKAIDTCADNENSVVRTWVYGFANLFNMMHYENDVVIDRHCLTTFYYNADDASREIYKYMQTLMGKPDFVFILRANPETRRMRICNRDKNDPDLKIEKKMQYGYDKMEEAAKFLELNYQIIDTDDKDIDMVAIEIMKRIKGD